MTEHEIRYKNVELTVKGYFQKGQEKSYLSPHIPDSFEILGIFIGSVDITSIIDAIPDGIFDIESLVIDNYYSMS